MEDVTFYFARNATTIEYIALLVLAEAIILRRVYAQLAYVQSTIIHYTDYTLVSLTLSWHTSIEIISVQMAYV